jgi:flagellin FlaB
MVHQFRQGGAGQTNSNAFVNLNRLSVLNRNQTLSGGEIMSIWNRMHRDERGQTALEAAIILIAFIVVASVFAFAILSAGSASTEKGEAAIYAGLEGVQSSMTVIGTIIGNGNAAGDAVDSVVFTLGLVSGGDPVDLTSTAADRVLLVSYRDAAQYENNLAWDVEWVGANDADDMLEEGERAELTVYFAGANASPALGTPLGVKTPFSLEIKPPTGAVLSLNRTPAAIEAVMDLR